MLFYGLPWMVSSLTGAIPLYRYGVGGGLLVLMAIPMGVPFPLCLRLLSSRSSSQVPWACGIDSSLAVLTGPVAALVAFRSGFSSLSLLSGAAYLLAAFGVATVGGVKSKKG